MPERNSESLVIAVDFLNDQPFLEVMQLAIDVAKCAEDLVEGMGGSPDADRLRVAVGEFRDWFRNWNALSD